MMAIADSNDDLNVSTAIVALDKILEGPVSARSLTGVTTPPVLLEMRRGFLGPQTRLHGRFVNCAAACTTPSSNGSAETLDPRLVQSPASLFSRHG